MSARNGVRGMCELEWGGQRWQLRADRSLYWPARQTLVVADIHFGKAEHFRRSGIPVPTGTTRQNLERLEVALSATDARRLVVLGDLFHNKGGVTEALIEQLRGWRSRWDGLEVVNVRGNHDRQAGDPPSEVGIECVSGPWRDPREAGGTVAFAHEPAVVSQAVTWCGHVHPAVRLEGRANVRLRAACFHVQKRCGTLPAFGAFTGMKVVRPRRGDRLYAIGPGQIVDVTPAESRAAAEGCGGEAGAEGVGEVGALPVGRRRGRGGRGGRRSPQY